MRLTREQYNEIKNKLLRLCGIHQPLFYENGTFEIYNIPEIDLYNLKRKLEQADFVANIDTYKGKADYNHINFNRGFPEAKNYWNIRGYVTVPENESLDEAVEIHDKLNPKIWTDDQKLIPEVRSKIIQIVEKFKEYVQGDKVPLNIVDVYLLGSNANYNYNDDSDLDLHIIVDESTDCINKHLPLIYNAYKSLFNSKYQITIKGINVEIYVENKDQLTNVSAGIYSLKDGWIKNPDHYEIPDIDQDAVAKGVDGWEKRYFQLTEDGTVDQIDAYIDELYQLRQDSIQKDGEFGLGNLIFKEVRRLGYLDDLKELKNKLTAKELSLENLEEEKKL